MPRKGISRTEARLESASGNSAQYFPLWLLPSAFSLQLWFDDSARLSQICGFDYVPPARLRLACLLCGKKGGMCVQCSSVGREKSASRVQSLNQPRRKIHSFLISRRISFSLAVDSMAAKASEHAPVPSMSAAPSEPRTRGFEFSWCKQQHVSSFVSQSHSLFQPVHSAVCFPELVPLCDSYTPGIDPDEEWSVAKVAYCDRHQQVQFDAKAWVEQMRRVNRAEAEEEWERLRLQAQKERNKGKRQKRKSNSPASKASRDS